jgi:hypothetical protein
MDRRHQLTGRDRSRLGQRRRFDRKIHLAHHARRIAAGHRKEEFGNEVQARLVRPVRGHLELRGPRAQHLQHRPQSTIFPELGVNDSPPFEEDMTTHAASQHAKPSGSVKILAIAQEIGDLPRVSRSLEARQLHDRSITRP